MAISPEFFTFQVPGWANDIYMLGKQRFTARDGCTGIPVEAHQAVKQYGADHFDREFIDSALTKGYINEQEHADTVALIPPTV